MGHKPKKDGPKKDGKGAKPPKHHKPAKHGPGQRRHDPGQLTPTPDTPGGTDPHAVGGPQFAQPVALPDPTGFTVPHPSDNEAYKEIDALAAAHKLRPMGFPIPRGGAEPVLTFADTLGPAGAAITQEITANGQIVFHSVGDTGNIGNVAPQNAVADALVADFTEADKTSVPQFYFHLGDVIYNFGEAAYYYDQFYDPYRNYPAPIVALAGNHDGMVAPGVTTPTLAAFQDNFCQTDFQVMPEAGGLNRTAQIQPGVFFTFEAPFVRILALYSNVFEDPGVLSSQGGTYPEVPDAQLDYLHAALSRAKQENYAGALIIAHHHPAYTAGGKHGWSIDLRHEIDAICEAVGIWPHAVLSAHAHNYQRFTRAQGATQIPYVIAGGGGHGIQRLSKKGAPALRVPVALDVGAGEDAVTFENYDDTDYGYLRIIADPKQLRIEYHAVSLDNTPPGKAPDDSVTIDLATRTVVK